MSSPIGHNVQRFHAAVRGDGVDARPPDAAAIKPFSTHSRAHRTASEPISSVSIDMSPASREVISQRLLKARITVAKLHNIDFFALQDRVLRIATRSWND
ncbi:hypothetical protein [Paraburkholderia unamae]|uniref:hypothetical protein n=1 Tax=Paraburkholderia unamae TaxID=219649 RepID=UPI0010578426|nr:hypothetical protein [Paraburkholderia unamae]